MVNEANNNSAVPGNGDPGFKDHTQIGQQGSERAVVLITGDSLDHPLELISLLRECGCNASVTADLEALQDRTHAEPDVIVLNFADVQTANPEPVQVLRKKYGKPVVCLLPHPAEQEVDRVAALGGDLLIFKPLCAEEFKSRIRILLWEQRARKTRWPSR